MKRLLLASALSLFTAGAFAQTNGPVGMNTSAAINATTFANNTDSVGFSGTSLTASLAVPSTSTAQATFVNGAVATGTVITTRTTVITTCSSSTGVTLPPVQRMTPITLINRSGGSCLVFPTLGATVETAKGTNGSANAAFTMLTNTDITFTPVSATYWVQ
jgi:hypothetical protein